MKVQKFYYNGIREILLGTWFETEHRREFAGNPEDA